MLLLLLLLVLFSCDMPNDTDGRAVVSRWKHDVGQVVCLAGHHALMVPLPLVLHFSAVDIFSV